jgi:hypothetical protein
MTATVIAPMTPAVASAIAAAAAAATAAAAAAATPAAAATAASTATTAASTAASTAALACECRAGFSCKGRHVERERLDGEQHAQRNGCREGNATRRAVHGESSGRSALRRTLGLVA